MPETTHEFYCGDVRIGAPVIKTISMEEIARFLRGHHSGDEGEATEAERRENARIRGERITEGEIVSRYSIGNGEQLLLITTPVYFGSHPYEDQFSRPPSNTSIDLVSQE